MTYSYRTDTLYRLQRDRIQRNRRNVIKWALVGLATLLALGILIPACVGFYDEKTVTTVINDKERVCDSNTDGAMDCKYLIFTDAGTFELTDSLIIGRFNSSDVYGRIKPGSEYVITYYGWRQGLFSMYPNIKDLQPTGL